MNTIEHTHPDDAPRSLQYEDVRKRRRDMLEDAHIAPLTRYVEQLSLRPGVEVPCFDPLDGGINAKILFLLEKPSMTDASRSGAKVGSGFISRNNNDDTAEATWNFMYQIALPRKQTVIWNYIPWWNGTRKVTPDEKRAGIEAVRELVKLLKELKVIVLVGTHAQSAEKHIQQLGYTIIHSDHPSPIVRATRLQRWREIPLKWEEAKTMIDTIAGL